MEVDVNMLKELGISEETINFLHEEEKKLQEIFSTIDNNCLENSLKVLGSFHKHNVSDSYFNSTTGYGYNYYVRDNIEQILADVLDAEDAIVRSQFISGTHALTVALFAYLRPNDKM